MDTILKEAGTRHTPLTVEYILRRLSVDIVAGRVYWVDATKYHPNLIGKEAGRPRPSNNGKLYWVVKIDGVAYLRSQLILSVVTGCWPTDTVDHKNGDSLDDRAENLRHATQLQNAWNLKGMKRRIALPMGIRKLPSGRYQARLTANGHQNSLGSFAAMEEAVAVYRQARKQNFGEFA